MVRRPHSAEAWALSSLRLFPHRQRERPLSRMWEGNPKRRRGASKLKRHKRTRRWFRRAVAVLTSVVLVVWIMSAWYRTEYRLELTSPDTRGVFEDGKNLYFSHWIRFFVSTGCFGAYEERYGGDIPPPLLHRFALSPLSPDVRGQNWLDRFGLRSPIFGRLILTPPAQGNQSTYLMIHLPLWMIAIPLAAATAWCWRGAFKRRDSGDCPSCGYSLTRNISGRCPECAKPVDPQALK